MTTDDAAGDGEDVLTLQALIRVRMTEQGWTYNDLERRAVDKISRQRWSQLGTGRRLRAFPEPETLQAIADALEIDVTAVVLAAAQSLGLDARRRGPDFAQLLPAGTDALDPRVRDSLLSLIRASVAVALAHSAHEDETNTPSSGTTLWRSEDLPVSRSSPDESETKRA